jgi:peptide/nickel transport system substrate-binding protein
MNDDERRFDLPRRRIIQGLGAAGIVSLAGCTDGDDGADTPTPEDTTTEQPSDDGEDDMGGETTTEEPMGGGSLTLAQVKSPIEFDPIVLNDVPSGEVSGLVFDTLYTWGEPGEAATELVPQVAGDMPEISRQGKRYVVPIDDDATFQNGDPVTAEDVAYSFTAPVEEDTENAGEFNMIDTVEPVDDGSVQFDLKFPFGAFPNYITWSIVPKSVREEDKDAFNTEKPVGAGPFKFEDWTEGDFVRLTRWDDYWGDDVPNLQEIEFRPVEEGTTRITTLRNGENDVIKEIPPKSWPTVRNMDNADIAEATGINYFYLAFNCNEGPTTDPQVREAIDYAVNMDQAIDNFVKPTGVRQYSPVPRTLAEDWDFPLDEWESVPHDKDIDQAKSLLDDSDAVPDDWKATIIVPPDDKREQIGVTVSSALKEAGYDAEVQRLDWGAFLERYISGDPNDYNMYTLGWAGSPDPDTFMYFLFSQEQEGTTNGTFYQNDDVDENIMGARESTDRSARQQMYEDAITTILEDRAHLPAYGLKESYGVNNRVEDFMAHPVGGFSIFSHYNNVSVQ